MACGGGQLPGEIEPQVAAMCQVPTMSPPHAVNVEQEPPTAASPIAPPPETPPPETPPPETPPAPAPTPPLPPEPAFPAPPPLPPDPALPAPPPHPSTMTAPATATPRTNTAEFESRFTTPPHEETVATTLYNGGRAGQGAGPPAARYSASVVVASAARSALPAATDAPAGIGRSFH